MEIEDLKTRCEHAASAWSDMQALRDSAGAIAGVHVPVVLSSYDWREAFGAAGKADTTVSADLRRPIRMIRYKDNPQSTRQRIFLLPSSPGHHIPVHNHHPGPRIRTSKKNGMTKRPQAAHPTANVGCAPLPRLHALNHHDHTAGIQFVVLQGTLEARLRQHTIAITVTI